jgi:hypothetical protein
LELKQQLERVAEQRHIGLSAALREAARAFTAKHDASRPLEQTTLPGGNGQANTQNEKSVLSG